MSEFGTSYCREGVCPVLKPAVCDLLYEYRSSPAQCELLPELIDAHVCRLSPVDYEQAKIASNSSSPSPYGCLINGNMCVPFDTPSPQLACARSSVRGAASVPSFRCTGGWVLEVGVGLCDCDAAAVPPFTVVDQPASAILADVAGDEHAAAPIKLFPNSLQLVGGSLLNRLILNSPSASESDSWSRGVFPSSLGSGGGTWSIVNVSTDSALTAPPNSNHPLPGPLAARLKKTAGSAWCPFAAIDAWANATSPWLSSAQVNRTDTPSCAIPSHWLAQSAAFDASFCTAQVQPNELLLQLPATSSSGGTADTLAIQLQPSATTPAYVSVTASLRLLLPRVEKQTLSSTLSSLAAVSKFQFSLWAGATRLSSQQFSLSTRSAAGVTDRVTLSALVLLPPPPPPPSTCPGCRPLPRR